MNLLKHNPAATVITLVVVALLAVFAYLYATDPDREPASASGTAPASAPSMVAPSAGTPSPSSVPDAGEASPSSGTGTAEPEATPSPSSTAAQPNSALSQHAPEEGPWRETSEAFAAAYYDTHGGDQDAWLAGMEPYVTEDLLENFSYTHIANIVDDEVKSTESVELRDTTMTFKIHTAENGSDTIALMELQPSGDWVVSAVGLTSTDLE